MCVSHNMMIERIEKLDFVQAVNFTVHCDECGGAGFKIEADSEHGEIQTGCMTCYARNLDAENALMDEEQLKQQEAALLASLEDYPS